MEVGCLYITRRSANYSTTALNMVTAFCSLQSTFKPGILNSYLG